MLKGFRQFFSEDNTSSRMLKSAVPQMEIALSSTLPAEPLPLIEGNEAMLQRALNILIDNAICYTLAGGHIAVEVSLQVKRLR